MPVASGRRAARRPTRRGRFHLPAARREGQKDRRTRFQAYYGGRPAVSVGDAFSWAWNKFRQTATRLVVASLVYGVLLGIAYVIAAAGGGLGGSTTTTSSDGYSTTTTDVSAGALAIMIVGYI